MGFIRPGRVRPLCWPVPLVPSRPSLFSPPNLTQSFHYPHGDRAVSKSTQLFTTVQSLSRGFYPKPLTVNVRQAFHCVNEQVAVGGSCCGTPIGRLCLQTLEGMEPRTLSAGGQAPQLIDDPTPKRVLFLALVLWYMHIGYSFTASQGQSVRSITCLYDLSRTCYSNMHGSVRAQE